MNLPLDQIICGDNCDVLGTLPRECIDLVVTSPPYDDLRSYSAGKPMSELWDFYGVAWQLKRVLKLGGVIVWVVADATKDGSETGTSMRQALHFKEIGLRLHDTMIYAKTTFSNPYPNRYHQVWEYAFVLSNGEPATFNPLFDRENKCAGSIVSPTVREADGSLGKRSAKEIAEFGKRFNVWTIDPAKHDGATLKHPAIFPEDLARDHILSWSNEGDIVLDPFSGSGTTAKMARELGRHYIGIEVNESYVEISRKRLAQQLLFGVEQSA